MDITHDNVCSSMLSCFYSHLLSTGRPISSYIFLKNSSLNCVNRCNPQSSFGQLVTALVGNISETIKCRRLMLGRDIA